MNKWTVIVEKDQDSEDLILPIPEELMEKMGWKEGDDLEFDILDNGCFSITRA